MSLSVTCPLCGRHFTVGNPGFDGYFQFACPGGHFVALRLPLGQTAPSRSWSVRIGGGAPLPLADRSYIIGRLDAAKPSDISIPGDTKVSRRSARLSVKGPSARLSVLSAKNPLVVNGKDRRSSGDIDLADGTVVRFGMTDLTFSYK